MKKQNITLYLFLALGLAAIISIYIANQSLKETLKKEKEEKEKLQAQSLLRQGPTTPRAVRKKKKFKEVEVEQPSLEGKESVSLEIPDDNIYPEEEITDTTEITGSVEGTETQESQEIAAPQEGDLGKGPSPLRPTEPRGAIIY